MTKMITKAQAIYTKYRELIMYSIFGVLTTVVDFGSYLIMTRLLNLDEHFSNIFSQILAILFAFYTNKFFVFNDKNTDIKSYFAQFAKFVSLRLVTLALNSVIFSLVFELLNLNDILTKVLVAVIVVILNYIFSKLIVFKKKES